MDPSTVLKAILVGLKQVVPIFTFRAFVATVHIGVVRLVGSEGNAAYRCINSNVDEVVAVASHSHLATELLNRLGYVDFPRLHGAMVMEDYETSLPYLKAFCELAEDELVVSHGDPVASSLPQTTDRAILVFHLGYHLHIRFQMLCFMTPASALHVVEPAMLHSATTVDNIASILGVMPPGSPGRLAWDAARATALTYVQSRASQGEAARHEVDRSLNGASHQIRIELTFRVSSSVVNLVGYLQNVQALVGTTMRGGMLSREGIGIYLSTVMDFRRECFSEHYMSTFDAVHHLMMLAVERPLTEMEVDKVHVTSLWQADNMVTHFRPRCFESDMDMRSMFEQAGLGGDIFTSLRGMGLEQFAPLLNAPTEAPPSPHLTVVGSVNEESGDEREKEDESEKQDKAEKECCDEDFPEASGVDEGSSGAQTGHVSIEWLEHRLSQSRDLASVYSVLREISTMRTELEDKLQTLKDELDGLVSVFESDIPEVVASSLNAAVEEKREAVRSVSVCFDCINQLKEAALEKLRTTRSSRPSLNDFSCELLQRCLSILRGQPDLGTDVLSEMTRSVVEVMPMDVLVTLGDALNLDRHLLEGDRGTLYRCIKIRHI